jgi:hypothetical protein
MSQTSQEALVKDKAKVKVLILVIAQTTHQEGASVIMMLELTKFFKLSQILFTQVALLELLPHL